MAQDVRCRDAGEERSGQEQASPSLVELTVFLKGCATEF